VIVEPQPAPGWERLRWRPAPARAACEPARPRAPARPDRPPLIVIAVLIAVWWLVVVQTESAIFPTPWQVVTGALELARDGTLWEHIGASLFRVGTGFGLAFCVAIPLGLWMGWVGGAYRTLNPIFQMLRPISPIAWIPIAILWFGVGDVSPIFLIFISSVFPMIVQTTSGRAHDRAALPARRRNFGVSRAVLFRQVVIPGGAARDHRRHADRHRRRLARRRRRRDDRAALGPRLPDHGLAQRRQPLRPRHRQHDHHRRDRPRARRHHAAARAASRS
jgi:hypothetical protein